MEKVSKSGVREENSWSRKSGKRKNPGYSGPIQGCLDRDSLTLRNSVTLVSFLTRGKKNPGKTTRARTPAQGRQNRHSCHFWSLLQESGLNIKDHRRHNCGTKSRAAQELTGLYRERFLTFLTGRRIAGRGDSWLSGPGLRQKDQE